jgi:sec-independent protein translocase protein TatC
MLSLLRRGNEDGEATPLIAHLLEVRRRLLIVIAVFVVFLIPCAVFSRQLFVLLALPIMQRLPAGSSMIATGVASPFLTPFKLAAGVAAFATVPVALYQAWGFLVPGLYKRERHMLGPLLALSLLLFYLGMAFAYFVIAPLALHFFIAMAPPGVKVMTDIGNYLSFAMTLFFAFGFAFELPIIEVALVWLGALNVEKLRKFRPYMLICAFVIGMLLTPPDMFSQTLLAVPLYALYELGILLSRFALNTNPELAAETGGSE